MKIYTRTGDDGTTGLFGGSRVYKHDRRIDCFGTVDELNAAIGLASASLPPEAADLLPHFHAVQNELFTLGSHLATPPEAPASAHLPPLDESMVARLEMQIDAADEELPQLKQFILPGGHPAAAHLHLARTICRRAERLLVAYAQDRPVPTLILTYLNRLSDWLFTMARLANHRTGTPDVPWAK